MDTLLLNIPALTATKDGCDALRSTVGKMFSHQRVIGFSCKDDIKRLRASPCLAAAADHWFPQNEFLCVEDLRRVIAEASPLGGGGRVVAVATRAEERLTTTVITRRQRGEGE